MMQQFLTGRLRVGIVGIGFGQQVHLPVFRSHPQCEVVGLCASTYERAAAAAIQHGVPHAFGTWQELIDSPEIDIVSVAVPPSQQPEIVHACLVQGKPVFCEKPVGYSATTVAPLVHLAQQYQLPNVVDFEFPEIPTWQRAKTILSTGELGRLRHVIVNWNLETYANKMGLHSWKTRFEDGGGVLYAFISHSFYYLEWLLGRIARLSAYLGRAPGDARSADTLCVICLEMKSGCIVSLTASNHAFLGAGHRLEFYADHGTLILENPTVDYVKGFSLRYGTRSSNRLEVVTVDDFSDQVDGRIAAVTPLVSRFIDWCTTGRATSPTLTDGWRVQQLLDTALAADEAGCWLDVAEE
jgi:predicted dehydrogenase